MQISGSKELEPELGDTKSNRDYDYTPISELAPK
jgi:hypothetical protein